MPTEGVVASHEDKEAAHWKSRQIGCARSSPHGSTDFKQFATATQLSKEQVWEEADLKEANDQADNATSCP
jgi:hypothetical protein